MACALRGQAAACRPPCCGGRGLCASRRFGRPPEGALAVDCQAEGVRYGALASGSRLRLFRAGTEAERGPAATTSYLELDAADLRVEDRPLLGLLGPAALEPDGLFDYLVAESKRFGAELRTRLDEEIRTRVLPELARGLGSWAVGAGRDLADPAVRRDIENASLTWVFRALFVLYAESAGDLPVDHAGYQPTALTTLTEQAAGHSGLARPEVEEPVGPLRGARPCPAYRR